MLDYLKCEPNDLIAFVFFLLKDDKQCLVLINQLKNIFKELLLIESLEPLGEIFHFAYGLAFDILLILTTSNNTSIKERHIGLTG